MAAAAILDFVASEIWRQGQSRLYRIYLHTKFGEDILKGGRVMAIYVFLKFRPPSWIFREVKFEGIFVSGTSVFLSWAKFCVNICNSDWVIVVKLNFQNGGRRHLGFC